MDDHNTKRIVVLVDMDCFYCQVEVQHNQSLVGKPVAVVQYNSWKGGGIIAVNYEARAKGVNRYMRGNDAVKACPDLNLVRVKELHGKADLSKYRIASQKVFEVISEFSPCVQRASIDEAYIDLTNVVNDHISSNHNPITEGDLPNTFVEGYSNQHSKDKNESIKSWLHDVYNNELQDDCSLRLTIGAMMVEKLRESIFNKTGFRCSAGISNNKILAKLACGLHKPNQQTLLPPSSVPYLFETIPIRKVRNLGGKLGNRVRQEYNCEFMSDLAAISLSDLRQKFDSKTSNFLYQIAKGIDNEVVESRLIAKSIGSCKSFPLGLKVKEEVQHWLNTLINDVVEKLEADYQANKRKATSMTVSVRYYGKQVNLPTSHCGEVTTYDHNKLLDTAYSLLCTMTENQKSLNWKNPISFLGLAIGKFVEHKTKSLLENYFNKEISKNEKMIDIQLNKSENKTSCSKISYVTLEDNKNTPFQEKQLKNNAFFTNQLLPFSNNINIEKNEVITNNLKNIKTMFAEINKSKHNSIETVSNVDITKEKQNKLNASSFFNKKLETLSSAQNSNNDDLISAQPTVSSFFSKKLEPIYPLKNFQNNIIEKTIQPSLSFFSKKLEIVSPSKNQTIINSASIVELPVVNESFEEPPIALLCERCEKMIDIDEYDEHVDLHVAMDLSKNLNDIVQPAHKESSKSCLSKKKTVENGQKRKYNKKNSTKSSKKPCTSISSYFKPILNS